MAFREIVQFIFIMILFCVLENTLGQIPSRGKCPDKSPLKPIDIRKLWGVWYETERTASMVEWPYKCITFKVQPFFEHKSNVSVTAIHRFSGNLENHAVPLWLTSESEGKDGKLWANLTILAKNDISRPTQKIPIQILATDDDNKSWAIAYSCREFHKYSIHTESVWIFSRQRLMSDVNWRKIRDAVIALNLETFTTRETQQTGCAKEDDLTEDEGR